MKRLAFIHGSFPAGGAERVTINIAEYLKLVGGYEIYVYASNIDEKLLSDKIRSVAIIRQISSEKKTKQRTADIERLIKEDNINILIQTTKRIYDILGVVKRTGIKVVFANHGEPFWQRYWIINRRKNNILKKILWKIYNRKIYEDKGKALRMAIKRSFVDYKSCDAYTVLCDAYKKETEKAYGLTSKNSHIYAIENAESPIEDVCLDKEKIILFSGRLECISKRIERLLRIWSNIQTELVDWQLVLVGDGPHRQRLQKMAEKLNLQRCVFKGKTNDMTEYYRKASIVCLVSQTEGWPLALTEAQAHGCIPVAFGCSSGVVDILSPNGVNGFIVTPFDEKEYAETLIKIAKMDKSEQKEIRLSAINKRLQYTPEKLGEKYRMLFDKLLN